MMDFRNQKIVNELVDENQVRYYTWTFSNNGYWDIIVLENRLMIVGMDMVSSFPWNKISYYGAYFGNEDPEYEENYIFQSECDWIFGDGEFCLYFGDISGCEWWVMLDRARFEDAKMLYKYFEDACTRL